MSQSKGLKLTAPSPELIRVSLWNCMAWCSRLGDQDPATSDWRRLLRSPEMASAADRVFPDSCHTPFTDSMLVAMEQFLADRADHVNATSGLYTNEGRLEAELHRPHSVLVTDWSASLFDGSVEPETNSFINFDGLPPWDTWIGLFRVDGPVGEACLLSWVPRWAEEALLRGINADASGCYTWLIINSPDTSTIAGWRRI